MEPTIAPQEQPERRGAIEVDGTLVEDLSVLIADGQRGMVLNLAADLRPADLAALIEHLGPDEAWSLFHWLPTEIAGDILPELEEALQQTLLEDLPTPRITALVDEMDSDDAADLLGVLPDSVAQEVLPTLEDSEEVTGLMAYGEDTAGGIMAAEFVVVPETDTIADVTETVRSCADEIDPIFMVYVVDADERLVGGIALKSILLARADARAADVMERDLTTVDPFTDQEEVARIMERYDLFALPVVDDAGRLLGRITIDDVVDVIREEAEEDYQRASGISGDEELSSTVFQISRGRLVWLLLGLVGALLSGFVIKGFEEPLQEAVSLAMFIPVVMAMAGNAGIQSSAIAVQGLASGDLWRSDVLKRLTKELAVALINGVVVAVVLAAVVLGMGQAGFFAEDSVPRLALTAGLALLIVITLSTTLGATIPLMLDRFGIDPALATGPFVTTSNDIFGLLIYFLLASLILNV